MGCHLFENSVEMRVLGFFLERNTSKFYVKQLARELKISPSSASRNLRGLHRQGFLSESKEGKENYYSLLREKQLNKSFAVAYFLFRLEQFGLVGKLLGVDEHAVSVVLYGSIASGDYDESSDLDLLIISKKDKGDFYPVIKNLEEELKREVLPVVLTPSGWLKLAAEKDGFYSEVVKNNIPLFGSGLVMR